jgi:hypothetical protein
MTGRQVNNSVPERENAVNNRIQNVAPAALKKPGAAGYIGVSTRSLERLVASGKLTPRRAGTRTIVFLVSELDEFLQNLPTGGAS